MSALSYIAKAPFRWAHWRLNPGIYPPGPRGHQAAMETVRAFRQPEVAADYYPRMIATYGKFVMAPAPLGQRVVYVATRELNYMSTEHKRFPRSWLQGLFASIVGKIIATDGPDQLELRRLLNAHLNHHVVAAHIPDALDEINKLLDTWEAQSALEDGVFLNEALINMFSTITGRLLAGGASFPAGLSRKIVELVTLFQQSPYGTEFRKVQKEVFQEVGALLDDATHADFGILSVFANRMKAGQLTRKEAVAEVVGFLNAAVETSSNTLCWAIRLLSLDQERYDKVREEAERVFAGRDAIEPEEIRDLAYTLSCIKEAARLYPVVYRELRRVGPEGEWIEYQGKKYFLPFGTQIFTLVREIQTDKDLWGPEAHRFNPELHMSEEFIKSLPKGAYASWGQGPHRCPGENFSQMEMTLFLARLAMRCRKIRVTGAPLPIYGASLGFPFGSKLKAQRCA